MGKQRHPRPGPKATKSFPPGEQARPLTSDNDARNSRIWQLELAGYSSREIGAMVGLSHARVLQILTPLRQSESPVWPKEEIRAVEHARLLRLLRALEPGVEAHDVPSIKEARQISESIRVLYGANGAIDVNVTETTQSDLAVQDMLNEAKMRAATERAKVTGDSG